MRKINAIIGNGIIVTVTTLLLRWMGLLFNGYISKKLGAEGMGVFGLVQSVFGFAVTFSCAGINLGAMRLISQSVVSNVKTDVKNIVKSCIRYSLFFSMLALVFLTLNANRIGEKLLGDARTIRSIRVLAASLPFISCSSVMNGYFSAVRKAYKNSFIMISEHFVRVWLTTYLFTAVVCRDVESACVCVAVGSCVSEVFSFCVNYILYFWDSRRYRKTDFPGKCDHIKRISSISLPIALSSCVRSALLTIEHMLIPYGLRKCGLIYSQAMAEYGIVNGMVFPVILFPACIVYAFVGIIIPEFARLYENREYEKISGFISVILRYTVLFSICVSAVFICYSYEISNVFYGSAESYEYIRLFAPLVSVMYLDSAIDGILKGLNEQVYSMKINIADAVLSVVLVYLLVPIYGIKGYIFSVFVCEIFNCSLSLVRLLKIFAFDFSLVRSLLLPLVYSVLSTVGVILAFNYADITEFNSPQGLVLRICLTCLIYMLLIFLGEYINKKIPSSKK